MKKDTILVIEDDPDILKVLADHLELDGFMVRTAGTGEEGKRIFRESRPDLIILDLNLPDIDGIRVCSCIRKVSDAPIIMLTARDSLTDKVRGFECGADDYIVKPFEYLEIVARIRACLRRTGASGPKRDSLLLGDLAIDLLKKEVRLGNRLVKLTKKEFELLELLISHDGEVLTRDYITAQLWPNEEVYAWSRALDVHVRRLRQKMEPDPTSPRFILTHTGVGYRFDSSGAGELPGA